MSAPIKPERYLILDETQRTIWSDPNAMPEVAISHAQVLCTFQSAEERSSYLAEYLRELGAKAKWSDVRPIETCAICGNDFDTRQWHRVVAISDEIGPEDDTTILDGEYPARFCTQCIPVDRKGGAK